MKEPLSRKLTFGLFYLLSSSITSLLLNVIIVGYIARVLGVENFGFYSLIISFVGLFQFLSDFGLNKTLLKFGSVDRTKAQISFGNALFLKSILTIPTLILVTFLGLLSGYRDKGIIILVLFTFCLIFDSFGTLFSSIRRILGGFKLISFFRVLRTAINLIIIILALRINASVMSLAVANVFLSTIVFVISLINTVLLLKPKLRLSLLKEFFQDSIIFSLSDFFLNVYARISTVLLSFFCDLHTVGIYGAAIRFTRVANLLPNQVKFALLPTMYRILEEKNTEHEAKSPKRVFTILLKYMGIFSTITTILILFFSEFIIHLVFGKKYDSSITLVQLFSLFIYLRFIETPFSLFYIAMNKNKQMLYFQGITSFINVILNLALIKMYALYGACYATLISECLFVLMLILIGSKYLIWNYRDVLTILLKGLISGFVSISIVKLLLSKTNTFIEIISVIVIYFLVLLLTRTFNKEDKELFLKITRNKKQI